MVQLLLNMESGLLMKASHSTDGKLLGAAGKVVKFEVSEMNTVQVENTWYVINGYKDGLAILEPIAEDLKLEVVLYGKDGKDVMGVQTVNEIVERIKQGEIVTTYVQVDETMFKPWGTDIAVEKWDNLAGTQIFLKEVK